MITPLTRQEAETFFAEVFGGKHHIDATLHERYRGVWSINRYAGDLGLCTYDGNDLTRLVLAAHEFAYRLSIQPSGPRLLRIESSRRDPGASTFSEGHDTIEQAALRWRGWDRRIIRVLDREPHFQEEPR